MVKYFILARYYHIISYIYIYIFFIFFCSYDCPLNLQEATLIFENQLRATIHAVGELNEERSTGIHGIQGGINPVGTSKVSKNHRKNLVPSVFFLPNRLGLFLVYFVCWDSWCVCCFCFLLGILGGEFFDFCSITNF